METMETKDMAAAFVLQGARLKYGKKLWSVHLGTRASMISNFIVKYIFLLQRYISKMLSNILILTWVDFPLSK